MLKKTETAFLARNFASRAAMALLILALPGLILAQGSFNRLTPETHLQIHQNDPNLWVIPPYYSPELESRAFEFQTRGAYDNGSWFLMQNDNYLSHEEDHVLAFTYNGRWSPGGGWYKPIQDSHWLRMGFESRFVFDGDPAVKRGYFEWNIDIDPTTVSGVPTLASRPWGFIYDMDARRTELYIGDPMDPNSGFAYMGGGHGFWANKDIIRFADRSIAGKVSTDITTQGRIILDPGGRASSADRAVMIRNMNGDMDITSGVKSDGVTAGRIFLGRMRNTRVVIGNEPFTPQRFMIDGQDDQIQFRLRGNATQTQQLMTIERSDGSDLVTVSGAGQLGVSNLGIELNESDLNPACGTGNYTLYADNSEARVKLCTNGRTTDVPVSLTGSAVLDFSDQSGFSMCSNDQTIAVSGAADGDVVLLGVPSAAVITGGQYTAWVSAPNTVSVRLCCLNVNCPEPAAGSFKVRVEK